MPQVGAGDTLFIPNKALPSNQTGYGTDMRTIEQWANSRPAPPGPGITEITSMDGSVTITNPTGPVVDLSVASTASGYLSLTGPGQFTTPGDLTQEGGFTVNGPTTVNGATVLNGGLTVNETGGLGITLSTTGDVVIRPVTGQIIIENSAGVDAINVTAGSGVFINGLTEGTELFTPTAPSLPGVAPLTLSDYYGAGTAQTSHAFLVGDVVGDFPSVPGGSWNAAWGFTNSGHIYYNNGSSWHLVI